MNKFCRSAFLFGALTVIVAAASLLPPLSAPALDAAHRSVEEEISFDGSVRVVVQGACVGKPGSYRVPFGCTYGELFALAEVEQVPAGIDPGAEIPFSDAVLADGEYCVYLVF